jgi:hypothetical protein
MRQSEPQQWRGHNHESKYGGVLESDIVNCSFLRIVICKS